MGGAGRGESIPVLFYLSTAFRSRGTQKAEADGYLVGSQRSNKNISEYINDNVVVFLSTLTSLFFFALD